MSRVGGLLGTEKSVEEFSEAFACLSQLIDMARLGALSNGHRALLRKLHGARPT